MNRITIDLGFANLVAEKNDATPGLPQLDIALIDKDENFIQDIMVVSQAINPTTKKLISNAIRCLVWQDAYSEDYTDEIVIDKYLN